MKKTWIGRVPTALFLFLIYSAVYGAERPNFDALNTIQDTTFLLSTKRSGSNLLSTSLLAITRKPIAWLDWRNNLFTPDSEWKDHPSYNRLKLPLISDEPLLYRTHFKFAELAQIPSEYNRLIFLTRNPKELLYREFLLSAPPFTDPNQLFVDTFLDKYLQAFKTYNSWTNKTKRIVFYEDLIRNEDEIFSQLLEFMGEEPKYLDDFLQNKEEYKKRVLESYKAMHKHNRGGGSSTHGPSPIYYSKNASPKVLAYIDEYLKQSAPRTWVEHLKRFEETVN